MGYQENYKECIKKLTNNRINTKMNLRQYQSDAIKNIKGEHGSGVNKQVIVLATGLGKTVIFAHLVSDLIKATGKKALVVAHREELLNQAEDKIKMIDPALITGIEQANLKAPSNANTIIASVPTLGRTGSERINKFDPKDFCAVIIDEAHHASADTYKNVLRTFGLLKGEADWNKSCLLLGVTATPSRTDNKGIDQIFDKVTYEYGIVKGIEDGWLVRIKAFRVDTTTDLRNVKKTAGDFNLGQLGEAVNNEDRNGLIVSAYNRLVPNQKALVFAVDVQHTIDLHKRFEDEGIKAGFVIGATPKEERHATLKAFSNGDIKVLVNCAVLTEGFDEPTIDTILMARPTQSGILYQQMIGRGTRLNPGKEFLTLVDFYDNTYRQKLQTTASLLGMEGALDFKGNDILITKEKVDELLELAPSTDLSKLDLDKIDYAIEEVDLLSGLQVPTEISNFTHFDWHRYDEQTYRIGLGGDVSLSINKTLTGQYRVSKIIYIKQTHRTDSVVLGERPTLDHAVKSADAWIEQKMPDALRLVSANAGWRNMPPSEAQIETLRKFRVNEAVIDELDKGKASRLLTKLINKNNKERIRRFERRW